MSAAAGKRSLRPRQFPPMMRSTRALPARAAGARLRLADLRLDATANPPAARTLPRFSP
jgi:hypothetical protein